MSWRSCITKTFAFRRQGEAPVLFGGVGLPSGLSQKDEEEDEAVLFAGSVTRADQILVEFAGFPVGRSTMN